ncbi:MAG: hypothetical protein ABFS35_18880 [Bacteroidota bacterium]
MKKRLTIFLFILISIIVAEGIIAQDKIITKSGTTIEGDITSINDEAIFINMKVNDNVSKTFVSLDQIEDFFVEKVEKLRNELDTATFFAIKLEDGTGLMGKIIFIDKSKIIFDDNNLGKITISGETIVSATKENKSAFYQITLIDGNELHGQIIERRKNELDIQTKSLGKVTVSVKNIKKMREVTQGSMKGGEYWFPNPNNTRYLFAPTGIPLKKGEGYYQNAYVVANSVQYGLSDNFSIGGGIVLPVVAFLTPKVGFTVAEKFHVGGGAILALMPEATLGILYGVTTYGTDEHNVTVGLGYGFIEEEFTKKPIINLAGMTRVSKRVALVTENWMVPYRDYDSNYNQVTGVSTETYTDKYYALITYGLRIMKERITFDIALVNSKDIIEFLPIGIPYIDFVYKF